VHGRVHVVARDMTRVATSRSLAHPSLRHWRARPRDSRTRVTAARAGHRIHRRHDAHAATARRQRDRVDARLVRAVQRSVHRGPRGVRRPSGSRSRYARPVAASTCPAIAFRASAARGRLDAWKSDTRPTVFPAGSARTSSSSRRTCDATCSTSFSSLQRGERAERGLLVGLAHRS
jgi:hypothetical protein